VAESISKVIPIALRESTKIAIHRFDAPMLVSPFEMLQEPDVFAVQECPTKPPE
jgi:hypothetical protein